MVALDVGCDTGQNFPFPVRRLGAAERIIGVDYSLGMLDAARRETSNRDGGTLSLAQDDAAKLATTETLVDAAVSVWWKGTTWMPSSGR